MQTLSAEAALSKTELKNLQDAYDVVSHAVCRKLKVLGEHQWGSARHEPGVAQLTTFRSKPQYQVLDSAFGLEEVVDRRFQWAVRSIPTGGTFEFWAVTLIAAEDPEDEESIRYLVRSRAISEECSHHALAETLERRKPDRWSQESCLATWFSFACWPTTAMDSGRFDLIGLGG
ncbi:hypothetical protein [Roseiconus lacunae]|uniref:hypothetical protein n=1 Tax=Roseiconus lacunae TaxID=2605694 RepID=UPI001E5BF65E|nr:hypothetical protein [Roseiconus lacunae]MCD0462090.1 hypothetical protein [Roseiconus lacunae]